jgi:hypothetical protein
LPGVEWLPGDLEIQVRSRLWRRTGVNHCAGGPRPQRCFDRVNAEGAGRIARVVAASLRAAAIADVLAGRRMPAFGLRRQQVARQCAVSPPRTIALDNLRPPACSVGDRELLPCSAASRSSRRCRRRLARFSLIHVDDLATACCAGSCPGYGLTFELDDGRPGGYDWDTVLRLAGRALREGRPVRRVRIPMPLLGLAASANLGAARLLGYAPMLTPGKVREITHPDWLCDSGAFVLATGWRPALGLESGLARAYGRHNAGTI